MNLSPTTTAFVFPGQGSQTVGMGRALAENSSAARKVFEAADQVLGFGLSELCWNGPDDALNDTLNAQPTLYVCSMAALAAFREQAGPFQPAMVAGHSLGEITALAAAGAVDFDDGLRLVRQRGRLMKHAGTLAPSGMAAVLGLDAEPVADVCRQAAADTSEHVQVANDNCPGQVVISGQLAALERATELAKSRGARRVIRLPVTIASHSPLMAVVTDEFGRILDGISFTAPAVPVVGNVNAQPLADGPAIRAELRNQLISPVRWTETIRYLVAQGMQTFLEFGSKDVLTGLTKRIDASVRAEALGEPEAIRAIIV